MDLRNSVQCSTVGEVEDEVRKIGDDVLVIIYFIASWSEESLALEKTINGFIEDSEDSHLLIKVSCDETAKDLTIHFGVNSVPTTLLMKNKKVLSKIVGYDPEKLLMHCEHFSEVLVEELQNDEFSDLKVDEKIEYLIKNNRIMVFMKGSKDAPFCKFSKQLVATMNQITKDYETYDVFEDEELRQRIKVLKNWPSFPQVYVDGELIGGVDIVLELYQSGELQQLLVSSEILKKQITSLINKSSVMLFMKGKPDNPMCGFSKAVVAILNSYKITYDHFDILTNYSIREELKKFSNWPTYPQLYVKGELIGGYDIIKELHENGELESYLVSN